MSEQDKMSAAPLDVSSAAPQGAPNVPNLMVIGAMPVNTQMDVETDILDSVVNNESFCRFRLQNKGILHSNSKLTFSLDTSTGDATMISHLPLNVGIHSLIQRAVLKVGGKTICETDDFNHFMAFRSTFVNPKHNKERECITSGRQMARKWEYNLGDNTLSASGNASNSVNSVNEASKYTLDFDTEVNALNTAVADRAFEPPQYLQLNAVNSVATGGGLAPVWQISLNDLFPFLKLNQLPLYMISEDIDIELHFADENRRAVTVGGVADAFAFKIDANETKMVADYIFYPQEIMEAYANANSKMSFTYVDYRLNRHTVVANGAAANQIIQNVGGAGRVVNKLFFGLNENAGANPERSLLNVFTAEGLVTDADGEFGTVTHNIKYNDKNLYPLDIKNNARIFHNIEQAEASTPFISKDEFSSTELDLITTSEAFGYDQKVGINNKFFYVEDRLNRNERVNSRGIEVYHTWNRLAAGTYTMRTWLETVRYAVLDNGKISCYYA
jgi:hypothetical protein